MAFISPEYAKTLQKTHGAVYWKVYDSGNKVLINKLEQDIGLSASQDMLQETLENCIGDYVVVKLYTIKPERREAGGTADQGLTLKVKLEGSSSLGFSPGRMGAAPAMGQPSWRDMLDMQEKMQQIREEKLRMELAENTTVSPWAKIAEKLLENDALILGLTGALKNVGRGPAVAAPAPAPSSSDLDNTLSRLSAVDPDYKNTLEKMTAYLERNPGVIDQIKPIFDK